MATAPTPMPPGSLTVPLWFGWGEVALVLLLVLLVGLAAVVALAAGRGDSSRSEWEALLDGRAAARGETAPQAAETASR